MANLGCHAIATMIMMYIPRSLGHNQIIIKSSLLRCVGAKADLQTQRANTRFKR